MIKGRKCEVTLKADCIVFMLLIPFWIFVKKQTQTTLFLRPHSDPDILLCFCCFDVFYPSEGVYLKNPFFFVFSALLFICFPRTPPPPCRLWVLHVPTQSDAVLFRAYDDLPVGSGAQCGSLISSGTAVVTGSLTVQNQTVLKPFVLAPKKIKNYYFLYNDP